MKTWLGGLAELQWSIRSSRFARCINVVTLRSCIYLKLGTERMLNIKKMYLNFINTSTQSRYNRVECTFK